MNNFFQRPDYRRVSICKKSQESDTLEIIEGETCEQKVAIGRYRNDVNKTGWGVFEVETFPGFSEQLQSYAAGVAEGHLTKLQIYYHWQNTVENMCKNQKEYCKKLYKYIQQNLDWINKKIVSTPKADLYWHHVNLTYTQLTGIHDGYRKLKDAEYVPNISFLLNPILMIQLSGELIDLNKALNRTFDAAVDDPEPSKCSGFLKATDGNKDLLFSHVSMSGFHTMNRVLKLYKFAYDKKNVPGHTMSFSGYPGAAVVLRLLKQPSQYSMKNYMKMLNLKDNFIAGFGQLLLIVLHSMSQIFYLVQKFNLIFQ